MTGMNSETERYSSMNYPFCGKSGLRIPVLSLGGWHNFDTYERTRDLCLYAFARGITHIDLANNYGPPPGTAERHFGRLLKTDLAAHRDELVISTKAGFHMWKGPYGEMGSRKHVLASLDQSLQRLGLDYVDIFYSHRFDPDTPLEETMGALRQAVVSGKALYAAISNYPAEAVKKAAKLMAAWEVPLVLHQCAYNMFRRNIEGPVLKQTAKRGMGMIVFSPLAQGLLTNRYLEGIPEDSRAGKPGTFLKKESITEDRLARVRALEAFALSRGQSLARLALQWCLRDPRVTSVLIGASRPGQIEENLRILDDPALSDQDQEEIETLLSDPEAGGG